jgi:hypothetical protein
LRNRGEFGLAAFFEALDHWCVDEDAAAIWTRIGLHGRWGKRRYLGRGNVIGALSGDVRIPAVGALGVRRCGGGFGDGSSLFT